MSTPLNQIKEVLKENIPKLTGDEAKGIIVLGFIVEGNKVHKFQAGDANKKQLALATKTLEEHYQDTLKEIRKAKK